MIFGQNKNTTVNNSASTVFGNNKPAPTANIFGATNQKQGMAGGNIFGAKTQTSQNTGAGTSNIFANQNNTPIFGGNLANQGNQGIASNNPPQGSGQQQQNIFGGLGTQNNSSDTQKQHVKLSTNTSTTFTNNNAPAPIFGGSNNTQNAPSQTTTTPNFASKTDENKAAQNNKPGGNLGANNLFAGKSNIQQTAQPQTGNFFSNSSTQPAVIGQTNQPNTGAPQPNLNKASSFGDTTNQKKTEAGIFNNNTASQQTTNQPNNLFNNPPSQTQTINKMQQTQPPAFGVVPQPPTSEPSTSPQNQGQKLMLQYEKSVKSTSEYIDEWRKTLVQCYKEINTQCQLIKLYANDRKENFQILKNFKQLQPVVAQNKKSTEIMLDTIQKKQLDIMAILTQIKDELGTDINPRHIRQNPIATQIKDCRDLRKEVNAEEDKYSGQQEEDPSNQQLKYIFFNLNSVQNQIRRLNHIVDHYIAKIV